MKACARKRTVTAGCAPALALLLALLQAACAPEAEDLEAWTQKQRASVKTSLPPLAEAPRFAAAPYVGAPHDDPFDPRRVAPPEAPPPTAAAVGGATRPGAPQARPLEEMTLIGTLRGGDAARALVRIDGQVHAVSPGDSLGPNRGRVARIEERRIEVRETVRTASGQWTERVTTLLLQGDPK